MKRTLALSITFLAVGSISTTTHAEPSEHSFEGSALVGAKLPGEISPVNWFHTETAAAPLFGVDASWLLAGAFSLGAYARVSPFSFDRKSGNETIGSGDGLYVSAGAVAKLRIALGERFLFRPGLTLGWNHVSYDGKTDGGTPFELTGGGLQVGLVADAVLSVGRSFGLVGQLGFVSQPTGSADVKGPPTSATAEGTSRKFGFAPIFTLVVGPELRF